jgi:hypothetical protein
MPGIKTDKKRATRRKPRRNHYAKLLESKQNRPQVVTPKPHRKPKHKQEVSDE